LSIFYFSCYNSESYQLTETVQSQAQPMIVKPRKVEPGWLTRWPKDAFLLMSRAWILWIGVATLIVVCGQSMRSLDTGILAWPLSLVILVIATDLARISDHKFVTGEDLLGVLKGAAAVSMECLRQRWFTLGAVSMGLLLSRHMMLTEKLDASQYGANIGPDDLWAWLFSNHSSLGNTAMVVCIGAGLFQSIVLPGFVGCLLQTFGKLESATIQSLLDNAMATNMGATGGLTTYVLFMMMLAMVMPVAAWALAVFAPALMYVAFREMFVDGNGNRKRAPRTVAEHKSKTAANAA
jgi:hypothetical protein